MIRKILGICGLMVLVALATARMAKADDVDSFTYTSGSDTFVWQLPASPGVDPFAPFGFMLSDVGVSENGGASVPTAMAFWTFDNGGGFDFQFGDFFAELFGDQLYDGLEANPTFKTGTFLLTDYGSASASTFEVDSGVPGTLVISKVSVPEPSTAMLLIVGSLGLLLVTKRRG